MGRAKLSVYSNIQLLISAILGTYLVKEVMAIAMPLSDPSLSKVTELLVRRNIAEKPSEKEPLMINVVLISETHSK